MKKTFLSLLAAAVVGTAGLTAEPQPAHAVAWWVAPAIIGGVVVGVGVGAVASGGANQSYAYEPSGCRVVTERINGQRRRVEICN